MFWHYTTQSGLKGIAQSKALWATNIRYLNDATEYLHAVNIAQRLRRERLGTLGHREQVFLDKMFGVGPGPGRPKRDRLGADYFVVSLTQASDRLSQWRAYGGRSGYCIGWEESALHELASKHGCELWDCIYNEDEQIELIWPLLESAVENWRIAAERVQLAEDNIPVVNSEEDMLAARAVFAVEAEFEQQFGRIAALCKNPEFREEDEWRLVKKGQFLAADKKEIAVEAREGKNMLIPYISFPLTLDSLTKENRVTKIIVGPNPEPQLALQSALGIFRRYDWPHVDGWQSRVPHRDWW